MSQSIKSSREKYWQKQIARHSRTTLSQREFCKRNGLSYWSFNSWKRRLSEINSSSLVEIPSNRIKNLSESPSGIELVINQSITIKLSSGFDHDLLRDIISALVTEQ